MDADGLDGPLLPPGCTSATENGDNSVACMNDFDGSTPCDAMSGIKLNQLEILVAVVDAGSFSAAAAELGCTQSRISHAIAELEKAVGTRVLVRSRAGCAPTEAGLRVLQKARQILRIAAGIPAAAAGDDAVAAQVRIACFRSVGTHLLPPVLEALGRKHPGIRVDVDDSADGYSSEIVKAVEQGRADIGIARRSDDRSLVQLRYLHDAYAAVVPSDVRVRNPATWKQFDGLHYIQPQNADGAGTLERCRAAGYQGKASRRMTNDLGILAMVARGLGFAIMPRLASHPVPPGAKLAGIPIELTRELALYMTEDTARLNAVKIVARFLRDKKIIATTDVYRAGVIGFDY
jgi:DNA-binding transcriptional LysR family regulator